MAKHSHTLKPTKVVTRARVARPVKKPTAQASPKKSAPSKQAAVQVVKVMNWKEADAILKARDYPYQQVHDTITSGPFWVYYEKK